MTFASWKALICLVGVAAWLLALNPRLEAQAKGDKLWVFVGTYSGKNSKGIYRLELDLATGKLSAPELAAAVKNPSFLAVHPNGRFLYAVSEVASSGGKSTGAVTAFALDPATGGLKELNSQSSGGAGPCHLVVDKAGKNVLVANYSGGSVSSLPIQKDGSLGAATAFVQHKGKSVDPKRQQAPYAHSVNLDPGNRFAFVADLGLDKVLIYRFDAEEGTLAPSEPKSASVAPGAGPRHFAFHPKGKYAYVINELNSTVTAFSYDAKSGGLKTIQTVTSLPDGFKGTNYPAEIVVHPSGKFVYGSNRGHNSIAIFSVDAGTGKLTPAGHQRHEIKTPRNFVIDEAGKYLLAGSQDSHKIVVFSIHPETGQLEQVGDPVTVPMPVCIRLLPR